MHVDLKLIDDFMVVPTNDKVINIVNPKLGKPTSRTSFQYVKRFSKFAHHYRSLNNKIK